MEPRDRFTEHDATGPEGGTSADGDAVEHLWNAAHEMLRAMRTLIDAADEFVDAQRGERTSARNQTEPREGRVHHINIDVRSDSHTDAESDAGSRAPGASGTYGAS